MACREAQSHEVDHVRTFALTRRSDTIPPHRSGKARITISAPTRHFSGPKTHSNQNSLDAQIHSATMVALLFFLLRLLLSPVRPISRLEPRTRRTVPRAIIDLKARTGMRAIRIPGPFVSEATTCRNGYGRRQCHHRPCSQLGSARWPWCSRWGWQRRHRTRATTSGPGRPAPPRSGSAARRATSSASTIARCRPTCAAPSRGRSNATTGRAKSAERRPRAKPVRAARRRASNSVMMRRAAPTQASARITASCCLAPSAAAPAMRLAGAAVQRARQPAR
jgi:hypothetical protein